MAPPSTTTAPFLADDAAVENGVILAMLSDDEEEEANLLPVSNSSKQIRLPRRKSKTRNHNQQRQQHPRQQRNLISTALQIATYLLAAWGLLSLLLQLHSHLTPEQQPSQTPTPTPNAKYDVYRPTTLPEGLNLCTCGTTIPEALSLNCEYDTLAAAWLPPHCRDAELTSQFDGAGPGPEGEWSYFADKAGTKPLTTDEVAALGGTETKFWASRRWHVAHCLFYWRKFWRMRETGVVMEERFDGLEHVGHCSRLILGHFPPEEWELRGGGEGGGGGGGGDGSVFLLDVPVMMNASAEAARRASRAGHHHS